MNFKVSIQNIIALATGFLGIIAAVAAFSFAWGGKATAAEATALTTERIATSYGVLTDKVNDQGKDIAVIKKSIENIEKRLEKIGE